MDGLDLECGRHSTDIGGSFVMLEALILCTRELARENPWDLLKLRFIELTPDPRARQFDVNLHNLPLKFHLLAVRYQISLYKF